MGISGQLTSSSSGSAIIGDIKSGLQSSDHSGWILLDGRAKTALTTTQQTAATSLGIGANIPNATGRVLAQGSLGAQIGSSTITPANLPNINLSGGNHSHTASDSGHNHQTWNGSGGQALTDGNATGSAGGFGMSLTSNSNPRMITGSGSASISVAASGSLSIPLGGSGTAYIPAAIGVNHFVYLGS
jgi:hypothetical protein